ncbi:MAG: acylneuraminate cytidylyltransferase family protein [Pseudomonadota bacterium]|jgi:CMP-N,N'-diacetyllegionaminic acid synthase|nr:acylneuraminate cytidylyltransferase family protein [Pseudomonadota bacterium]|tara:strand:- start:374 stop:1072 length:699 start_codon:yes stop_codon:yes gene_type:complete
MKNKQILCTICARGGSKGLPNKNLLKIGDKSLIGHTLTQAKAIDAIDCIIVSSDSNEILKEGEIYAADILLQRSAKLASDDAGKIDAIIDCLNHAESNLNKHFDYVIDLDVTSPLRNLIDIENCLEFTKDQGFKNLITVTNSKKNPYFNQIEITNEGPQLVKSGHNIKGRQSAPKVYDMNASIYVWSRDFLINEKTLFSRDTIVYDMPEERSLDIDNELDFKIVKHLIENEL